MADNGKGVLFKNDKKTTPAHPDYTGNIILTRDLLREYAEAMGAGQELKVQIASWVKSGQKGQFLSLSVNAPYKERQDRPRPVPSKQNPFDDLPGL